MKKQLYVSIIGALIVLAGTFLPWVNILGITANGWANGAGGPLFLIVTACVALGLNFLAKKWSNIVSIVVSLILILVIFLIQSGFAERGQSAAIGVWIMMVGGFVLIAASIMGLMEKKPQES